MKIIKIAFTFFLLQIALSFAPPQTGKLVIEIYGFKNNEGEADLKLYESANGFPEDESKAVKHIRAKISDNKCIFTFENLNYGSYGFIVYHDENDDKKFNKVWYGKPVEATVVSNYAKGFMKAPSFDDAKFIFDSPVKFISLKIHNF
ncbi:MAG: DUF2141 domain-containing protein [Bacteroidia bacterium]